MRQVHPEVHVIARTMPDYAEMADYLEEAGGLGWLTGSNDADQPSVHDSMDLVEFAGRVCYRSFEPGLNPNVTKVRNNRAEYIGNLLKQYHGSVMEHVTYSFAFRDVSRVLTHELVRHRVGTAVSQESMRYVRLTEIPFWFPDWAQRDEELMNQAVAMLISMEDFQQWMSGHFGLDEEGAKFSDKKAKTSFMRRFAPEGVGTNIVWTANLRTLRHVIAERTAPGAEEEIQYVFGLVARIMTNELPEAFGDFSLDTTTGQWVPGFRKV